MELNMPVPWKESFRVRTYEVDFRNKIKLNSIFNFLQETASNNAEQLGFGYNDLIKDGLFWVLSRARINISKYLSLGEEVIIETWPKGIDKLFALRDFKIYNSTGDVVGTATTCWLMVDSKTMRPTRPDSLSTKVPPHSIEPAISETPGKIIEPEAKIAVAEKVIGYSDIDINQHVNNVRYVEYVLDSFTQNEFTKKMISTMQINFLSQSTYADRIKISKGLLNNDTNEYYVEGINQNKIKIFQAYTKWL
jgi:medium-chain acyl-[acyl-carrier-protein] hydrolase